jgi:hypothetical protein
MAQTVRFSAVVAASGTPEVFLPFSDPARDKTFQRAVREQRVLTISQENVGTKKDFGSVGFIEGKLVTYLLFPKSLRAFEGKRVIGIRYDTLRTAKVASPKEPARVARKSTPAKRPRPMPAPPKPKQFTAKVHVTATADLTVTIDALNKSEARSKAAEAGQHVDLANATKRVQVKRVGAKS